MDRVGYNERIGFGKCVVWVGYGMIGVHDDLLHHGNFSVTPDFHLTYSKNWGNLGLVLKMKNIARLSIVLTKLVNFTYLYLFKFVLYSSVAFKANQ